MPKQTGSYVAATSAAADDLVFTKAESLRWFRSSDTAERGFCSDCGSVLFWRADGEGRISILSGALDGPTACRSRSTSSLRIKPDWYEILDGKPQ